MGISVVLFQDNQRLADNPTLARAVEAGGAIVPAYVLDDAAPGAWAMGGASRWWLHHSLMSLSDDLAALGSRLILRRGPTDRVLEDLIRETGADHLFLPHQYAPWSDRLARSALAVCDRLGVTCTRHGGQVLFAPEKLRTGAGKPYTVFTPFWKNCLSQPPPSRPLPVPEALPAPDVWPASLSVGDLGLLPTGVDWTAGLVDAWTPGEDGALDLLDTFLETGLTTYREDRDRPGLHHGTSRLSAHLHFGNISPRTLWHRVNDTIAARPEVSRGGETFLKELGWREFSIHLLHHFPTLTDTPLREAFQDFPWRQATDQPDLFRAWCRGRTGFPLIDAGMRELRQTGVMHNRVRMACASFLVKDLLIHWRDGARWFWDTLVDADIASNTASWQWVAGCGADAAPYFRIFNPILQGEKFDPKGEYVRRWVPELANLPDKYIHKPFDAPAQVLEQAGVTLGTSYPHPVVDRKQSRARALAVFKNI